MAIKEHLEALFSKEGMIGPILVGIHLGAILLKGIQGDKELGLNGFNFAFVMQHGASRWSS